MYVARSNSCISANTRLGDDRYLEFRARIRTKREREGARPSKGGREKAAVAVIAATAIDSFAISRLEIIVKAAREQAL